MADPIETDKLERLRQIELELNSSQSSSIQASKPQSGQSSPPAKGQAFPNPQEAKAGILAKLGSWVQPLMVAGGVLLCIVVVALSFRLAGRLLQLGLVVLLGLALYRFVVAPRLGLIKKPDPKPSQPDQELDW